VIEVDRIKLHQVSPEFYEAMQALTKAASKDIDPDLAELVKIRASQLNRCAFCLDMNTQDAAGAAATRLIARRRCGLCYNATYVRQRGSHHPRFRHGPLDGVASGHRIGAVRRLVPRPAGRAARR